ncbi:zinc ribbon domain-containing protein [Metallumcola ferriviriculae]|uniref:Zinc ribbon domain-containing protein n=1 Tax=Metallumcola ferriviriculae TaxID=3039180 RepID=A0AAU0UNT5_9FIRM|nr:zinc ribbon domain-containing protein [Desulfitibacteraceae bacterium MK1]
MPNYDFKCKECGELFSKRVPMNDRGKVICPKCSGKTEQRLTGFGLVKGGSSSSSAGSCGPSGSRFT